MSESQSVVSIQIDSDCINLVHALGGSKERNIIDWETIPLAQGDIVNGAVVKTKSISQKIDTFLKSQKLVKPKFVFSPPSNTVKLILLHMIYLDIEELEQKLDDKIGEYGFFQGQQVISDYAVAQEKHQNGQSRILLQGMMGQKAVDSYQALAEASGIYINTIEPSHIGGMRLMLDDFADEENEVLILLTLDSCSGVISVFDKGLLKVCQNISIGYQKLFSAPQRVSELKTEVETVIMFANSLVTGAVMPVMKLHLNTVNIHNEALFEAIKMHFPQVVLEYLSIELSYLVANHNKPSETISYLALGGALDNYDTPGFVSGINLVNHDAINISKLKKKLVKVAQLALIVGGIAILSIMPLRKNASANEQNIIKAKNDIAAIEKQVAARNAIFDKLATLKTNKIVYKQALQKTVIYDAITVLKGIGMAVPPGLRTVDIVQHTADRIVISGETFSEKHAYAFAEQLAKNSAIDLTRIEDMKFDYNELGKAVLNYTIICDIKVTGGER